MEATRIVKNIIGISVGSIISCINYNYNSDHAI